MTGHLHRIAAIAAALLGIAPGALHASDFRDAPTATLHGALGLEALYMFRDPRCTTVNCNSPNLVVALTVDAAADPMFGPSYHFEPDGIYRFNFTTSADAQPTATIEVTFGPYANGPACPAPASACQTFKAVFPGNIVIDGLTTQGTNGGTHNQPVVTTAGNIKIFAGPREDPFFFDQVGFERLLASRTFGSMTGVDAYLKKNANAIVLEFPVSMVFPAATCRGAATPVFSTPCGVWAVTYLPAGDARRDSARNRFDADDFIQLDRFANPLVTLALIPPAQKDAYNGGEPATDMRIWSPVELAQMLALDKSFGTCPPTATSAACNPNTPLLKSVLTPDTLKFASIFPDGYPNGRQLSDRVTDILISLIMNVPGFTDGTSSKIYCSGFPFLGPPLQLSQGTPFEINPQSCP